MGEVTYQIFALLFIMKQNYSYGVAVRSFSGWGHHNMSHSIRKIENCCFKAFVYYLNCLPPPHPQTLYIWVRIYLFLFHSVYLVSNSFWFCYECLYFRVCILTMLGTDSPPPGTVFAVIFLFTYQCPGQTSNICFWVCSHLYLALLQGTEENGDSLDNSLQPSLTLASIKLPVEPGNMPSV